MGSVAMSFTAFHMLWLSVCERWSEVVRLSGNDCNRVAFKVSTNLERELHLHRLVSSVSFVVLEEALEHRVGFRRPIFL